MDVAEVIAGLSAFRGRAAGTDSERRAALWLRDRLHAAGHRPSVQTVWVRPFWPLVHGGHALLAVVASAVSVWRPAVGLALVLLSLVSMAGDLSGAFWWVRRLTPRRATQNIVVAPAREATERVRLVLTANLDAGHVGAVYRDNWVRAEAAVRRLLRGHLSCALGLAALAMTVLAGLIAARVAGVSGPGLGAVQLIPTLYLAVVIAVLVDVALAAPSPGANANASGVAAAVALMERLDQPAHRPQRLEPYLVLAGAGENSPQGLAHFLRERARAGWHAESVAVIALEPCGVGSLRFFTHQGPLWAARLHPRLIECARLAAGAPGRSAAPHISHGAGAAHAARRRGWPALAVGALDAHDRPGRARQPRDSADRVDPAAVRRCVELCLEAIARLDAELGGGPAPGPGAGWRRTRDGPQTGVTGL